MICCTEIVVPNKQIQRSYRALQDRDCSCNPHTYAWETKLTNTCDNIEFGPGILNVECDISGPPGTPTYLTNVVVYESDGGDYLKVHLEESNLGDEALFRHRSILSEEPENTLVRYLGFNATGVLADGQEQQLALQIKFTNDCDGVPVLTIGNSFAWFTFNPYWSEVILRAYCPLLEDESRDIFLDLPSTAGTHGIISICIVCMANFS